MNKIAEKIKLMSEVEFTNRVVVPLIEKLHCGMVEYTHSSLEGGRDIVSFSKDLLGRNNVLCVQVKSNPISFGAKFQDLYNQCKFSKENGVTTISGNMVFPNEVWAVSSYPFSEGKRRQVSAMISDLERNNIKIIASEEICALLSKHLPEVVTEILYGSVGVSHEFFGFLNTHTEGRAFGLPVDRNIEEFHVPSSFSPNTLNAYAAVNGKIVYVRKEIKTQLPLGKLLSEDAEDVKKAVRVFDNEEINIILDEFSGNPGKIFSILGADSDLFTDPKFNVHVEMIYLPDEKNHPDAHSLVDISISFDLRGIFNQLVEKARILISRLPKVIQKDCTDLISCYKHLQKLELFIKDAVALDAGLSLDERYIARPNRIIIQDPTHILSLGDIILVEGAPGCGKTTLMKTLAKKLIDEGRQVVFVQCCLIDHSSYGYSFEKIIETYAKGFGSKAAGRKLFVILDGLDEAPFDFSNEICSASDEYKIIASTRTSYHTDLRREAFVVSLVPFTRIERNRFFEKWFGGDRNFIADVGYLINRYRDINVHTRLPLIATITASLIRQDRLPKTRADIYEMRMDLLLSKWDRTKNVKRIFVDNTNAKFRFLMHSAYSLHSSGRRRLISEDELLLVYEKSMGNWGYDVPFDQVIKDLVYASGVLVKEQTGYYSFGHLSFQEHLVGRYLSTKSARTLEPFLNDDWWRESLNFYASIVGSIDDLIDHLMNMTHFGNYVPQLREMVSYAPFTNAGAKACIEEAFLSDIPD